MMIPKKRLDRYVELLELCQTLQSEKDGVDRPATGVIDKTKTLDDFASDIGEAILAVRFLGKYSGMVDRLDKLGRHLFEQGEINVGLGDFFGDAALDHVMRHFGVEGPGSQGKHGARGMSVPATGVRRKSSAKTASREASSRG